MIVRSVASIGALLALLGAGAPPVAGEPGSGDPVPADRFEAYAIEADEEEDEEAEEEEEEELRERLLEREDRRRVADPMSIEIAERPLTIEGEYEVELDFVKRRLFEDGVRERDRWLLTQTLEIEAFYTWGPALSVFAQLIGEMEEDWLGRTVDEVSTSALERGEMWLYSEDIAGTGVSLDVGRLDFEDDRRWWWDDELDGFRVSWDPDPFGIELTVARELGSTRTDQSFVDPERDRVLSVLGEASWDWSENHAIELFFLHQNDHSPTQSPGDVVRIEREDDSDAQLTWIGVRWIGITQLDSRGLFGYWLDTAFVRGHEKFLEFEELTNRTSEVDERLRQDVRGWAIDAGFGWILPCAGEPRLFAGYAVGSGDSRPEEGTDRSFRQTGLQGNEAGFGGVERFNSYGALLEPELSNLGVVTVGAGLSLFQSSSLDLVYHHYRLLDPATSLRDAQLEAELTGEHRDLGQEIDLVLAIEEWEHLEFTLIGSAFRPGRAFGPDDGKWSYGGLFAMRIPF